LHEEFRDLTFGLYSASEIKKLSACLVYNPVSFNQLGHPVQGGLYDLRMGPFTDRNNLMCTTCLLTMEHCPGHIGHIELPLPVCNPLFYSTILRLLKMTCMQCHRFRVPEHLKKLYYVQQQLLDCGDIIAAQQAAELLVPPGAQDVSVDGDDASGKRRSKEGDAAVDATYIIRRLDEFLSEKLISSSSEDESGGGGRGIGQAAELMLDKAAIERNTRSVESLRKTYNKEFLSLNNKGSCPHCGSVTKTMVFFKSRFIYEGVKLSMGGSGGRGRGGGEREKTELNPEELKQHFRELWTWDRDLLRKMFPMLTNNLDEFPTDVFFVDALAVPPPRSRPSQYTGGTLTLHPQSTALNNVVESITVLKQVLQVVQGADVQSLSVETKEMLKSLKGSNPLEQMDTVWKELQGHVDRVLDREMNRKAGSKGSTGWGFKQLIERKQGLFRMHMMGKRVNFACRTVITPDPNIAIDEIGLPEVFAKKLFYKVPVTPWNVKELQEMVRNGPDIHPGACFVESADTGSRTAVSAHSQTQRDALAKTLLTPGAGNDQPGATGDAASASGTKYVYRHLQNGDAMLLNRQPTLHKPSIMSHRARVLKGEKVMRLHYAICKSYNADFDGDEMNAHFPQNELARSEAYNIVNVCKQYLVPKDGTPLQGLIQDHVIAGVKMTMRGRFFDRAEYQQHVYGALVDQVGKIKTLPPAILKPKMLWSGKQIVTTIILNLVPEGKEPPTLHTTAKIKPGEWEREPARPWLAGGTPLPKGPGGPQTSMSESEVIFQKGVMVSGVLDKNQFGATAYSLTHAFFELYGGTYSGKLLSSLSKIFTNFLHTEGFTLGVKDIVVTKGANKKRKKVMEETQQVGDTCAANAFGIKEDITEDLLNEKLADAHREGVKVPRRRAEVDRAFKEKLNPATNGINSACIPKGLVSRFPENNLQLMVQSGAKGSTVNTMQISCLLGQIELEGKRPPLMISGKSLPSFRAYDTRPIAGGFIDSRFMTGIKPQEFFFHCMAGREGLIDTAVKTSRSGYLQRCLIKLLEGLVVNYDQTVRDSDGSVVQFQYGEDAMDVCKSQYLKPKALDFLKDNMGSLHDKVALQRAKAYSKPRADKVASRQKSVKKWQAKHGADITGETGRRRAGGFLKYCQNVSADSGGELGAQNSKLLTDSWFKLPAAERKKYDKKAAARCPEPVVSKYRSDSNFASITEKMDAMIEDYLKGKSFSDKQAFEDTLRLKIMQAQVEPGEPVGVLAAQSVGEPSTQMTLNTFHFAGRGEMNVTLGIPRLREILMVASLNIKTPTLTIPFRSDVSQKAKDTVRILMNRVILADVLESVKVTERLQVKGGRARLVKMRFDFLPRKIYKMDFKVTPAELLDYFETKFITKVFIPVLSAAIKDKKVAVETGTEKATGKAASANAGEDDENDQKMEKFERQGGGEGHASSDEEDLAEDADATESRKKARQADQDFEEGLSDEEVDLVQNLAKELDDDQYLNEDDASKEATDISLANLEKDDGFVDEDMELGDDVIDKILSTNEEESIQEAMDKDPEARKRRNFVLNVLHGKVGFAQIHDYVYDVKKEQWCELTLSLSASRKAVDLSNVIKKAADKAVIREIKHIKRGIVGKNEKGEECLTTEGVNIDAMFKHENILDLNRLYCNNIHEMARYYGVEAAAKTIVNEICTVFKPYGIDVDKRHLTLIGDYMTFDGTYKPFNRIGIENNPSPLQQMTFETAIGFLRSATLGGKCDTLDSPSSRLVVGKPCSGGTGQFDLNTAGTLCLSDHSRHIQSAVIQEVNEV